MTLNKSHQLEFLISNYPLNGVELDVAGIVLDYMVKFDCTLYDVYKKNHDLLGYIDDVDLYRLLRCKCGDELKEKIPYLLARFDGVANDIKRRLEQIQLQYMSKNEMIKNIHDESRAVVWQLSDIHFGKLNKLGYLPKDMAAILRVAYQKYDDLRPDILIVSGDLTSASTDQEYEQFYEFIDSFASGLWGNEYSSRVLVVPGNHDIKWGDDGCADRMKSFIENVSDRGYCITPFGEKYEDLEGGDVLVQRYNDDLSVDPSIAMVRYEKLSLEFVLLVSGYFSYEIPLAVRNVMGAASTSEDLSDILRIDEGQMSQNYISFLEELPNSNALRFAVMHHNPVQYSVDCCKCSHATLLLARLKEQGINLLLHGHVHLQEDLTNSRNLYTDASAYPVPAPTLSSYPTAGQNGFSIHFVGKKNSDSERVSTAYWPMSTKHEFRKEMLSLRFQFTVENGTLHLIHR